MTAWVSRVISSMVSSWTFFFHSETSVSVLNIGDHFLTPFGWQTKTDLALFSETSCLCLATCFLDSVDFSDFGSLDVLA